MSEQKLKLGVLLPTRGLLMTGDRPKDASSIIALAERAEEAGLDSVWVGDSLTAKPRMEPITALAAVAARTQRVRLGTAVLLAALRHPVLLSHAVGTLDLIAGGRTVLAIGVGGAFNAEQQAEWAAAGVGTAGRASRLEELVRITKGLTAGEEVNHEGHHFQLDSVRMEPSANQPGGVPLLLGCHWRAGRERQFRRAAELADGFISISDTPEEFALVADKVRHYAGEYRRDFDQMESTFYMTVNLNRDRTEAAEEANRYLMSYYGANIWGERWGPWGPPELTVQRILEYVAAGAGTVIVRFASYDQKGHLETFLREVVPAL